MGRDALPPRDLSKIVFEPSQQRRSFVIDPVASKAASSSGEPEIVESTGPSSDGVSSRRWPWAFCAGATARRVSRRSRATTAADGDLPSRLGPPLGGAETTGAGFGPTPPARRASRGVIPLSAGPRRPFGQAMSSGVSRCAPTSLRADTGVVRGRPTRVKICLSCPGGEQIRSICWLERESFGKSFTICYEIVI